MNEERSPPADPARFQEACDWFLRLREQPDSTELIADWLRWQQDALNRHAFEDVRDTWRVMGLMAPLGAELATDTRRIKTEAARRRSGRSRIGVRLAAVAATLLAIASGISWLRTVGPYWRAFPVAISMFATAPAEHRSLVLADGSRVEMAGDSVLRVNFGEHARDIELRKGEAYFRVAHDKARPFIVHAGSLGVRAVGTRFDVRTADDRVVVAVEEGVVVVEPPLQSPGSISSMISKIGALGGNTAESRLIPLHLRGGQEIAVGGSDRAPQLLSVEPTQVASWREGRLRFAREPLQAVITSISAVSGRDIELADASLRELRFTGTVFSSGIEAWLHALPAIFPVTVRQDGARCVITRRPEGRN